ncbi:MAG: hypothetical protein HY747_11430 [Elusimicrobia bacterium]|nr:hypothetical protein [Elusimicrobiota bacterium]
MIFLFSLFLFAIPTAIQAEANKKIHILYAHGWQYGVSADLETALETLLREDIGRLQLNSTTMKTTHFSNGYHLFDNPAGLDKKQLSESVLDKEQLIEIEVLETPRSILAVYPKTGYPFLENILGLAYDPSHDDYNPAVRKRKAWIGALRTSSGQEIQTLLDDPKQPPQLWAVTSIDTYHILADSQPAQVFIFGKTFGGPARFKAAIEQRQRESNDPKLLILTGDVFLPKNIFSQDADLLKTFDDLGFEIFAPDTNDLTEGWPVMQRLLEQPPASAMQVVVSNLTPLDEQTTSYLRPWLVRQEGGVRIGIFALLPQTADASVKTKGLPYKLQEPASSARAIIKELRQKEKVDIVLTVSHMSQQENTQLIFDVPGIDILFGDNTRETATTRRTKITLQNWNQDMHRRPAHLALMPAYGIGDLTLELKPQSSGYELAGIEELFEPLGETAPQDAQLSDVQDKLMGFFLGPQETLLPQAEKLWPQASFHKNVYTPLEFWNLAAQIIRQEMGAEIALFRIQLFVSNCPCEIPENFIRQWMSSLEKVATVKLPGRNLRELLKKIDFSHVPVNPKETSPVKYYTQLWLAAAGLDKHGRVSGIAVKDDDLYSVAMPEILLKEKELGILAEGQEIKIHEQTAVGLILDWLKKRKKGGDNYKHDIRRFCEGKNEKRPIWRLNLRELSFQMANTQVSRTAFYSEVPNARVQAINQVFAKGAAKLFSEFQFDQWAWDTGVSADYGRLTLKPQDSPKIKNETIDEFVGETEVKYRALSLNHTLLSANAGPFLNVSYETEITKPGPPTLLPRRNYFKEDSSGN